MSMRKRDIRASRQQREAEKLTREEELAALIAEQEKDDRHGDYVYAENRLSLDYTFENGGTAYDVIGVPDVVLGDLTGEREILVRNTPRHGRWTKEQILDAIRKWTDAHGQPPRYRDWKAPDGQGMPSATSVRRKFGSWSAAIAAAGFTPRPHGGSIHPMQHTRLRPRIRARRREAFLSPEKVAAAYVVYEREGLSTTQLAERLYRGHGYRSMEACRVALQRAFHAEGFRLRSKSESVRLRKAA